MDEEVTNNPEEMISIPIGEYEMYRELVENRTSFWNEALKNPEGLKAFKEFIQGILETGLTIWAERILKKQIWHSVFRISVVVFLLVVIVVIATWLTSNGKLDAGAFTFLMGTIVGYILAFLTNIELS